LSSLIFLGICQTVWRISEVWPFGALSIYANL